MTRGQGPGMCGREVMVQVWVRVRVGTNRARELSAATSRVAAAPWVRACSVCARGVVWRVSGRERGGHNVGSHTLTARTRVV